MDSLQQNFSSPMIGYTDANGYYTLTTSSGGQTDAQVATPRPIQSALIRVGQPRASASNQLLQP